MSSIRLKRVYDTTDQADGKRILVDRLWPRGLSKAQANIDIWLKDIAPSNELREWFGHDPEKWTDFQHRYWRELASNPAVNVLKDELQKSHVTLVFGAKNEEQNNAVALKAFLEK